MLVMSLANISIASSAIKHLSLAMNDLGTSLSTASSSDEVSDSAQSLFLATSDFCSSLAIWALSFRYLLFSLAYLSLLGELLLALKCSAWDELFLQQLAI